MPKPPKAVNRYFVVLFQSGVTGDDLGVLRRNVVDEIQLRLARAIQTPPSTNIIDVWLESPGGDAHAAYKLFLELNHRCAWLQVVIPDWAKSAATLFTLGADQIFMAPAAELGPLDAQIEHPDREGVTVSALDVSKALGFLGDFALDYLVRGGRDVLESTQLPRAEVLRSMSRFTARLVEPIIAKLDPHLVHQAANELGVARQYAIEMIRLRHRKLHEAEDESVTLPEDEAIKLVPEHLTDVLCQHYPSHGFVISLRAARELGLPVKLADEYDYWAQVTGMFEAYRKGVFRTDDSRSMVRVWSQQECNDIFEFEACDDSDEHHDRKEKDAAEPGDSESRDHAGEDAS